MRAWWAGARRAAVTAWLLLTAPQLARAYTLDINSQESLVSVASSMADDLMSFYTGNQPGGTPGLLPQPYYWWEAGALMGAMIDYWYYTGNTTFNNITEQGLLFQTGPNYDYMPPNQTLTEGNDDQGFWGMAVMTAAEYNFQNPPPDQPQWLALAQAVFNTQAPRWEPQDCGGGLRWQIFRWNNGFDYKNSISQACFFNMAARLARYTGNQSYAAWADKTWDWMISSGFMDSESFYVYDGAHIENCTDITPYQWSYNAGAFLLGAAAMYNFTNGSTQELWRTRVDGLLNGTEVFFTGPNNDIMTEVACESVNLCDLDEQSFKAYLSRWMAATTKWAPWTYDRIMPLLQSSAVAAAAQCNGGSNGRMCGLKWTDNGTWDGSSGVGQQMAAMEIVLANMIKNTTPPVTNATGGTSQGDPSGGGSDVGLNTPPALVLPPLSAADRAGAVIITLLALLSLLAGIVFVIWDEHSDKTLPERLVTLRADVRDAAIAIGNTPELLRKIQQQAKGAAAGGGAGQEKDNNDDAPDTTQQTVATGGSLSDKSDVTKQRFSVIMPTVSNGHWSEDPRRQLPQQPAQQQQNLYQWQRHRSTVSESNVLGAPSRPAAARDHRMSYPASAMLNNIRGGGGGGHKKNNSNSSSRKGGAAAAAAPAADGGGGEEEEERGRRSPPRKKSAFNATQRRDMTP